MATSKKDQAIKPILMPNHDVSFIKALQESQDALFKSLMIQAQQLGKTWQSITHSTMPNKLEDAGIRMGSITGWRLWRVEDYKLKSISAPAIWYPCVPMIGDPDKPHEGVHAFRDPEEVYKEFIPRFANLVIGQVKMWGRYVEHKRGYRAEFARITKLIEASSNVDLDVLRTLYLDLRCPSTLTPVVDRAGRTVGVTSLKSTQPQRRWNSHLSLMIEDDRPPVNVIRLMTSPSGAITHRASWRTVSYQTHFWRGRALLLEPDHDPTWLPGWLPFPSTTDRAGG